LRQLPGNPRPAPNQPQSAMLVYDVKATDQPMSALRVRGRGIHGAVLWRLDLAPKLKLIRAHGPRKRARPNLRPGSAVGDVGGRRMEHGTLNRPGHAIHTDSMDPLVADWPLGVAAAYGVCTGRMARRTSDSFFSLLVIHSCNERSGIVHTCTATGDEPGGWGAGRLAAAWLTSAGDAGGIWPARRKASHSDLTIRTC
jgi:hypothetical protein